MKYLIFLIAASLSAAVTIPVTNTNWYFSPWTTYSNGSAPMLANNVLTGSTAITWNGTGYFKTDFTGTSVSLSITSPAGGSIGYAYSIDSSADAGGSITSSSGSSLSLATGLSAGTHTLQFWIETVNGPSDSWTNNPPTQSLTISGLVLDTAATVSTPTGPVAVSTQSILFTCDSTCIINQQDFFGTHTWDVFVALATQSEYGQIAWPGQGWQFGTAINNVPIWASSWPNYWSGKSRLISSKLSPIPSMWVILEGQNDGGGNIQANIVSGLQAARAAVNTNTPIVVLQPFSQAEQANIQAAITTLADPYVYYVNLGVAASYGLTNSSSGAATHPSLDGLHPVTWSYGMIAAWFMAKIQSQVGGTITSGAITISGPAIIH